ncbi:MAG: hypothetical protein V4541_09950 [Bacteroidota bacterium]
MKKILITGCFLLASTMIANAQDDCKVLMKEISQSYKGDCKNGKANGKGEAKGKDSYSGEFKNGLPDGKGNYLYSNGDFYNGSWSNGKKDGQGSLSFKREGKTDSLVIGFWKKDKYMGKYEHLIYVHSRTTQFTTIDIKKSKGISANTIAINLTNTTAGSGGLSGTIAAKPVVTDIIVSKGSYQSTQEMTKGPKTSSKVLLNVQFPFRAKVFSGSNIMDIEISEAGEWTVEAALNN